MTSRDDRRATHALPAMRGPGPTIQQLLDQERGPVPPVLRDTSAIDLGTEVLAKERYYDPEFARQEFDHMWSRVWQMACREEDIPEVGDHYVYEIGKKSVLVVRPAENEIKAFHNVCLHRGRILKDCSGSAQFIRCPFHGFTWDLDGSCQQVTNEWDFPHVNKDEFKLPSVHVGRWGGFIFVNLAERPESFESYMEDLPEIFGTRGWDLGDRVKVVHVLKRNRCNWKVALEAFTESMHSAATHPGAMPWLGEAFSQYDVWPDKRHYSRMISPRGVPSPHLGRQLTEEEVYQAGVAGWHLSEEEQTLPDGLTARQAMADVKRRILKEEHGVDVPDMTDCEAVDTIHYHIFPNLVCWTAWGSFLVYRFRPNGTDPTTSIMEIYMLMPRATGQTPVRAPTELDYDDSHHLAPELAAFSDVFDEDLSNMPYVQRGLEAMEGPGITVSRYHEMRLRFFHKRLDDYLDGRS